MTHYPLGVHGAIREWRVKSKRVFDIIVDANSDMTWNERPYRRNAVIFHCQDFIGPATGPFICYQRAIGQDEVVAKLFGGVDAELFGSRSDGTPIGPVGIGLVDAVEAIPAVEVEGLLQRDRELFGDSSLSPGFIYASSLLRPNGTRAVLTHVAVSGSRVEELFVWTLAHAEEPQEIVFATVRQYLQSEGLEVMDDFIEYISLPDLHPVGVLEEAFELRMRRSRFGL